MSFKRTWREASTLMILARDKNLAKSFDYKVLVFKRTEKTSFMPNSICFPGGSIDPSDENQDWLKYFQKFNISSEDLRKEFCSSKGKKSFIYENYDDTKLKREISLRIAALREAFEELGVVLGGSNLNSVKTHSPFSQAFNDCNIPEWQTKVHNQHETFMLFCEKHNLLPDLWNMYEWSTWLTPTFFRPRRFETAFFLLALNEKPEIHPESEHEVQEFMWETPENLLTQFHEEKLWLPPPQYYELTRLSQMKSIDEVASFAKKRNNEGNTLFMPVQFRCADGFVHVLPGDDLYPKNVTYDKSSHDVDQYQNETFESLRKSHPKLHRMEQTDMHKGQLLCNIPGYDGHIDLKLNSTSSVHSKL